MTVDARDGELVLEKPARGGRGAASGRAACACDALVTANPDAGAEHAGRRPIRYNER